MNKKEDEPKKDSITIPLENRRVFLPETMEITQERKLREIFHKMETVIQTEYQKEIETRKEENIKIRQMKKVLKETDRILVNTDKTKRIKTITIEEYHKAGDRFLADKKNYRKLNNNHSIEIEKKLTF